MAGTRSVKNFGMGSLVVGVLVLVGAWIRLSPTNEITTAVAPEVILAILGAGFAVGLVASGVAVLLLSK